VKRAILTVAMGLLVAACGGSSKTPTTPASTSGAKASSVTLSTASVSGLGTVLVNAAGRTLYTFAPDKAKKVTCTGSCAAIWPPLKVPAGQKASAQAGVKESLVSSLPNPSGGNVVTYNGWPLYLYTADQAAGTANGQALNSSGGLWYAISPSGTVITKKAHHTSGY
jgi:predicted lipoprotein with Yx(FWY)xxD motif